MRLIDADVLQDEHVAAYVKRLLLIDTAPTAIIHCQECVWWESTPCNTIAPEYHKCRRVFGKISMTAMDYCSWGVRRDT